jgi:hypothetical protein
VPVSHGDTRQWIAFGPGGIVSDCHDLSWPKPAVLCNWPFEEDYNTAV